jgi:hypothetical protein
VGHFVVIGDIVYRQEGEVELRGLFCFGSKDFQFTLKAAVGYGHAKSYCECVRPPGR